MEEKHRFRVSNHLAEVIKDGFSEYCQKEGFTKKVHLSVPEAPFFLEFEKDGKVIYLSVERITMTESEVEIGSKDSESLHSTIMDMVACLIKGICYNILKPFLSEERIERLLRDMDSSLRSVSKDDR